MPLQARSRKTQQDLLDALERLLSRKSFAEITVAEIAAEAGLTTGAIYRRFRDKGDLLRAAFDRFLERTEQFEGSSSPVTDNSTDRVVLHSLITGTLKFTLSHIPLMRAAASYDDLPSFDKMRQARNLVAQRLAQRLRHSTLPPEVLEHRAHFTLRMIAAVIRDTFLSGPGAYDVAKPVEAFVAENRVFIDQLISDLLETALAYLEIQHASNR